MSKDLNKILSENTGLSASQKQQIQEAWDARIAEARDQLNAELREEYARKYEFDKAAVVEAMDKYITDRISVELEEFAADKAQLAEERVAQKAKLKEHIEILNKFVTESLRNEVVELRQDKVKMNESFKVLENFVLKQLSEEIREFRQDKKALVEQKVKLVKEGKAEIEAAKKQFIARAAKITNEAIDKALRGEISQFKEDIRVSRENNFGRKMFEAMVSEYMSSYLNEGSEVKKLQAVISAKEVQLAEAQRLVKEKEALTESVNAKLAAANDRLVRTKEMSKLLAPLSKEKRIVMKDLLESVQTKDLQKQFDKYLPAVLNESAPKADAPKKQNLSESSVKTEISGNRAQTHKDSAVDELAHLKHLAGLK